MKQSLTPQWVAYIRSFRGDVEEALHAISFVKIRALAAVLRPLVEGAAK
jgi:hypothetical protein